jgi:hypothetical protein
MRCSRRPGADARQFNHDAVAFGPGGGDLGLGHTELVDAVLDDLDGALVGVRLQVCLIGALLSDAESLAIKGCVVVAGEVFQDLVDTGLLVRRDAVDLHGLAFHAHHCGREALFRQLALDSVPRIPQIGFQGFLPLDFQFEVDATLEIQTQPDLGQGDEEIGTDAADQ